MAANKDGEFGERFIMRFLHDRGNEVFQPDVIWKDKHTGTVYVGEVKTKNKKYNSTDGSFVGHGMNKTQLDTRLHLQDLLNVECVFFALDTQEKCIYWNKINNIYSVNDVYPQKVTSNYIITPSGIVVFDLNSLLRVPLTDEQYKEYSKEWSEK